MGAQQGSTAADCRMHTRANRHAQTPLHATPPPSHARPFKRSFAALRPLYRTEQLGVAEFRSRCFLPNTSPVGEAAGGVQPQRRLAIAAAALEACRLLHQVCVRVCGGVSWGGS